jgi:hypothetical protein
MCLIIAVAHVHGSVTTLHSFNANIITAMIKYGCQAHSTQKFQFSCPQIVKANNKYTEVSRELCCDDLHLHVFLTEYVHRYKLFL